MQKKIIIITALFAVGLILVLGARNFNVDGSAEGSASFMSFPSFSLPNFGKSNQNIAEAANEAWETFEKYLGFAKSHDLEGLRSVSHQISDVCNDPTKEADCFLLMDSVAEVANELDPAKFKHIQKDDKQVVMFTDGPGVFILYFTRAEDKNLRVLGLQFCIQDDNPKNSCVKTDTIKNDSDGDGWWDAVESLFYTK